jgi:hypothetical protein
MPNPKGRLIWLIGMLALLKPVNAAAQDSAENIFSANLSHLPDSCYILDFDKFPDNRKIMEFIENRDDVRIQNHSFGHYDELHARITAPEKPLNCAYYNPVKDKVIINFISVAGNGIAHGPGGIDGQISAHAAFRDLARGFNDGIPGILAHELWHKRNNAGISLYGRTFDEITEIQIHDELSAVIAELLFRRKIWLKTGSLKEAFRGTEGYSLRGDGGWHGVFHKYEKFLKKNRPADSISPPEADIMIKLAAAALADYLDQYAVNIPKIVAYKATRMYRAYSGIDGMDQAARFEGYADAVRKIYTFGGFCFLDACGGAGLAAMRDAVRKTMGDRRFQENISSFRISHQRPIDDYAGLFANNNNER